MSHEIAVRGAVIASWGALGAAVTVAIQRGARARLEVRHIEGDDATDDVADGTGVGPVVGAVAVGDTAATTLGGAIFDDTTFAGTTFDGTTFDDTTFDDTTRSALAACLFASLPDDHIWWTIMVVDPALHDTPSHRRLVGHFEAELTAVDAADHLVRELNSCLVPGEAPLTATAIGIEPEARPGETISHLGPPLGDVGRRRP